jgi:hypothetical protein
LKEFGFAGMIVFGGLFLLLLVLSFFCLTKKTKQKKSRTKTNLIFSLTHALRLSAEKIGSHFSFTPNPHRLSPMIYGK